LLKKIVIVAGVMAALSPLARAQEWVGPVRGSWVRAGAAQTGDVTLASPSAVAEIVISPGEHTAVQHAAKLLAGDIGKISGETPAIVGAPGGGGCFAPATFRGFCFKGFILLLQRSA
jgi:hypothetical protein